MFLMPVISLLRVFLQAFTDLNFICAHHKVAAGHLWAKFLIMSYYLAYVYFFISIFFYCCDTFQNRNSVSNCGE